MSLGDVKLHLVDSIDEVLALKSWLGERRPVHALGADLETSGLDKQNDWIRLAQIGDGKHGWAIPWETWNGVIRDVVKNWDGRWIFHNGSFDVRFLSRAGVEIPRHMIDDTMPMARIVEPNAPMGLKPQTSRHIDAAAGGLQMELDKATGWTWATVPIEYQPYWTYGALDPVLAYKLFEHHWPIVQAQAPAAYELEMAVLWVIEKMERYGAHVDRDFARENYTKFIQYCEEVEAWCGAYYNVKPGSNQAIIEILEADGFTFSKATKNGAKALDAEVLEGIDHPLANAVLERRRLQKMASTYLKFYIERADEFDLVHPSINTLGALTSRMSMSDPNLQNLPRLGTTRAGDVVRNCVSSRYVTPELQDLVTRGELSAREVALKHGTLIMCDFSQIEMRLLAHLSEEPNMIAAFTSEGDFFVNLARQIFQDDTLVKGDPRRQITKNAGYACVPLSTEIFTQRGWLKHDEVVIGDMTLGYNFETRKTEWTKITEVVHYDDADIVRYGNHDRSFEVTPNHRWVADHERTHDQRFIETQEHPHSPYRVVLAAESSVGGEFDITDQEAAILGWMFGDGSVYQGKFVGASSQGRDGHNVAAAIFIHQIKPEWVREIDELLENVSHKRYVGKRATRTGKYGVTWRLNPEWSRSLLQRVDLWQPETGARRVDELVSFDPWQFALKLSPEQRHIMVATLNAAEGGSSSVVSMSQLKDSPVTELMIALGYLTGHHITVRAPRKIDHGKSWTRRECVSVYYGQPHMTGQKVSVTPVERGSVWCVATTLGTWTMRQGDTPTLTGNTIYGAGVRKFAQTAGIEERQAREFMNRWNTMYPRVRQFQDFVLKTALQRREETGVPFITSPLTGRRYIAQQGKEYALVNYVIQGTAAETFKTKLIELDNTGISQFMVAPVHDEVILDVPGEHVLDVVNTLQGVMNDATMFSVPVEAEVSFGLRWGKKMGWEDN